MLGSNSGMLRKLASVGCAAADARILEDQSAHRTRVVRGEEDRDGTANTLSVQDEWRRAERGISADPVERRLRVDLETGLARLARRLCVAAIRQHDDVAAEPLVENRRERDAMALQ